MHVVLIAFAVVTLAVSAVVNHKTKPDFTMTEEPAPTVLSESSETPPSATPDPELPAAATDMPLANTPEPTSEPEPTPTVTPGSPSESGSLAYPGATRHSADGNVVIYFSNDSHEVITEWYKDKLRGMGLSVKSFVTTRGNSKVENKLVTEENDREVQVEITKDEGDSQVTIAVRQDL